MNYDQLFAELERSVIRSRGAYGKAYQAIKDNPHLTKLAEMAAQIYPTLSLERYQEGDNTGKLTQWNKIYSGEFDMVLWLPYERKDEARDLLIDLGFTKKHVDVNCYLVLKEIFGDGGPISVGFFKPVQVGDKIGKRCKIIPDGFQLSSYVIACEKDKDV